MSPSTMIRLALLVLLGLGPACAQDGIELRAAAAAPGSDTAGMQRTQHAGREVWVGPALATFEPRDIESVGLEVGEGGATAVSVWLSRDAAAVLARVTASATGAALAVFHRGRLLAVPTVVGGVTNGLVVVPDLDEDDGRRLARSLREQIGVEDAAAGPAGPTGTAPARSPGAIDARGETARRPAVSAPDLDAAATAQSFVEAVARRRWGAAADLLHPASWAAVRPDALSMLRLDGPAVHVRDGDAQAQFDASDVLGGRPAPRRVSDLGDRDLTALYLAALEALGLWGTPRPPRTVVGRVEDDDRVHVLLRAADAAGVSDVSAVTLRRDRAGRWRVLLTEARGF